MNQISEEINAFATPIRVIQNFLSSNECNEFDNTSKKLNFHDHTSFTGKVISTHDTHYDVFHCFSNSSEILVRLDQALSEYVKLYGIEDVKLTNSWTNRQYKDTKLLPHTHPMSVISGALYIKADHTSSQIAFFNPNPFLSILALKGLTQYNLGQLCISPKTGTLILFPSWLRHSGGMENNYSDERIVISFNTCYKNGV